MFVALTAVNCFFYHPNGLKPQAKHVVSMLIKASVTSLTIVKDLLNI